MLADGQDDHLAGALQNLGAGDQEGVDGLSVLPGRDVLLDADGFTSHGGLVGDDVVTLDEESVDGDDLPGFHDLYVADEEFLDVDVPDLAVADDVHVFATGDRVQLLELLLFDPVVAGGYGYDYHYCYQD